MGGYARGPRTAMMDRMSSADPRADAPRRWSLSAVATLVVPLVALVALVLAWGSTISVPVEVLVALLLAGAVLSAVHHAEVVAHRVGEPYGSLILAIAVTVIEVGLIIALMLSGGKGAETLARDTVFAAVMITCNGILGLSLLLGAWKHGTAVFRPEGAGAALAAVLALATLSLVLPSFTTSTPGPVFSRAQLAFAAVASLTLYGLFVFVQSVRHRDYFLPPVGEEVEPGSTGDPAVQEEHAARPSNRATLASLGLLIASLVGVVGLAKLESHAIEGGVAAAGLPQSFVGVVIAVLVLLPETLAAARNARRGRVQISLNLALGSAIASIGLTVPSIALASIWLPQSLELGLGPLQIVLLGLTAVVGTLTVLLGRATLLQAALHLVVCASFLYFAAVP
jgi:Ca2+:H+ antiporter